MNSAITMVPMMKPSTTIMIGSSRLIRLFDQDVDFLVVEVGDLVEHGVEVAGLFADVDHVDHHVVDQPALLAAAAAMVSPSRIDS